MNKLTKDYIVRSGAQEIEMFRTSRYTFTEAELERLIALVAQNCTNIVSDAVDHRVPASEYVGLIQKYFSED